jgi:hypothetical protein
MPRTDIRIGHQERLEPTISKATQLGLLPTVAIVWIGTTSIGGSPKAMRALADALTEAADMAEEYDRDPEAWNERERAERDADR